MKYQVFVESDTDDPENNGSIIYGPTSKKVASAFIDGVEYANDSALTVKLAEQVCAEHGGVFDDNPGKTVCKTCGGDVNNA